MSYSRNFGMRSFENIVRDGRFRVPATGNPILIGAPVILDAAAAGFVKPATAAVAPGQGGGIAVFEHIQNKSDALVTSSDAPYNQVPLGQYVQIVHGQGSKVWLKNTVDKTLYDGRVQAGVVLLDNGSGAAIDLSTLAPGDGLTPDGAGRWKKSGSSVWLLVEQVNTSTGVVEARLTF